MAHLMSYIERAPVIPNPKVEDTDDTRQAKQTALLRRRPFWQTWQMNGSGSDERWIYFHLESLRNYAQKYYGDRTPHDDIVNAIRSIGGEPADVNHMHKGKRVHRWLWRVRESDLTAQTRKVEGNIASDDTSNVKSDGTASDT
jgi:hypothetical protein